MKGRFAVKSSEGGKQEVEEVRNAPETCGSADTNEEEGCRQGEEKGDSRLVDQDVGGNCEQTRV